MSKNRLAAAVAALLFFFLSRSAHADRELIVPFHESGHLVFDQLAGLRLDPATGVQFAGPAGVAFHSSKEDAFQPGQAGSETKTTTFWFSPSADYFVTDHLSIGGIIEFAHTSGTLASNGQETDLPGTSTYLFMPRIGFYAPFSDRFGLWPRIGLGWTSSESVQFDAQGSAPVRDTFRAFVLDVDIALVYRFNETFFLKTGPEIGLTLGGRHTQDISGISSAADASTLQVSGSMAFGANIEL
ncbi:MAG TPA: hypothetical protein VIF62_28670 [Labilithrix sp.]